MTTTVMKTASPSGNAHQRMSQDSSHSTMWASRKTGVSSRQMWKAKVTTVSQGCRRQLAVPKGVSQCRIERRPNLRLM